MNQRDAIFVRHFSAALLSSFLSFTSFAAQEPEGTEAVFRNEPPARALYDQMVETMRKATTLSWVSDYRWEARGKELGHSAYKIRLKKPNYARIEAAPAGKSEPGGILVGDGDYFWTYWPGGKVRYPWERKGKFADEYDQYRDKFYKKTRTPIGRHSLGHEIDGLGAGTAMTILDPSTFHGYTDSLQPYIDAVRKLGIDEIGDEECDMLEVSIMKHQRSWYLWLSKRDHLPRKLKQIVRVSYDIITEELWSQVVINGETLDSLFAWKPPEGWRQWRQPEIEEGLLKPGTLAPDFELTSTDNKKLKLSSFRGQIVWLNKWRCG
jgi:hypothetical protein